MICPYAPQNPPQVSSPPLMHSFFNPPNQMTSGPQLFPGTVPTPIPVEQKNHQEPKKVRDNILRMDDFVIPDNPVEKSLRSSSVTHIANESISESLKLLEELGFKDKAQCTKVLYEYNGDVNRAAEVLLYYYGAHAI